MNWLKDIGLGDMIRSKLHQESQEENGIRDDSYQIKRKKK